MSPQENKLTESVGVCVVKGIYYNSLQPIGVGCPINKHLHARKTEKLEGVPHTKLCTSALLIPTHPLPGPWTTLDPKELNSDVTTEKSNLPDSEDR